MLPGDEPFEGAKDYTGLLSGISPYLLEQVKDSLHDITVENWNSFNGFTNRPQNRVRSGSITDSFRTWLTTFEPGETRSKKEFETLMGMDKKQKATFAVALCPPTTKKKAGPAYRALASMDITVQSKPGKGTVFTKN